MNPLKLILATLLLLSTALSSVAWADYGHHGYHGHHHGHGHARFGLFIGAPLFYSRPYPAYAEYPSYYASSPPVYVERAASPSTVESSYVYYCENPSGYYPDVRECPSGWRRIVPGQPQE